MHDLRQAERDADNTYKNSDSDVETDVVTMDATPSSMISHPSSWTVDADGKGSDVKGMNRSPSMSGNVFDAFP